MVQKTSDEILNELAELKFSIQLLDTFLNMNKPFAIVGNQVSILPSQDFVREKKKEKEKELAKFMDDYKWFFLNKSHSPVILVGKQIDLNRQRELCKEYFGVYFTMDELISALSWELTEEEVRTIYTAMNEERYSIFIKDEEEHYTIRVFGNGKWLFFKTKAEAQDYAERLGLKNYVIKYSDWKFGK